MNEANYPGRSSDVAWPNGDHRNGLPEPSTTLGSEKAAPAAAGLLSNAVQGAHDTIDRVADSAAPAVRQLDDAVSAAKQAMHAKAEQMRETRDAWIDDARATVRSNPLTCVAAAFALGAVIARLTR